MFQQPKKANQVLQMTPTEEDARKRLNSYIYEYLLIQCPKVAETLRNEYPQFVGQSHPPPSEAPGFLFNWWLIFWDLYATVPERSHKDVSSQEAKGYMDQYNAMRMPQGPMPMGGPNPSLPDYYGQNPGNGPSSQASPVPGYPPFAQQQQRFPMMPRPPFNGQRPGFVDPRAMQMQQNNGQRMGFPMGPRGMAPSYQRYMDSPSTPTFPPNGVMPNNMNGATAAMLNSPGPSGPVPTDPNMHPNQHYAMMMNQSGIHQFPNMGMGDPNAAGTPTSSHGPTSVPGINGAPASVPANIGGPSSVGSGHGTIPTSAGPHGQVDHSQPNMNTGSHLSNMLNGTVEPEMKQSPASVHHPNINGGTPLPHGPGSQLNNGPASAAAHGPSSVQSQPGAPHSVSNANSNIMGPQSTPQLNAQMTPTSSADTSNVMEFNHNLDLSGGDNDNEKDQEISKIKASLIEDFGTPKTGSYY